jgi:hypothetical protein
MNALLSIGFEILATQLLPDLPQYRRVPAHVKNDEDAQEILRPAEQKRN